MSTRIAILTPWYPSALVPGEGVFVQAQAEALAATGDIAVLTLALEGLRRTLTGPHHPLGVPVREGPLLVLRQRFPWALPYLPRLYLAPYCRHVERAWDHLVATWGKPDVLHAHVAWPMGVAALAVARRARVPLVLTEHFGPLPALLRHPAIARACTRAYLQADAVIAVSPALAAEITAHVPGVTPTVIGNVVDTDFFVPPASPRVAGPPRLLAMGSLVPIKGYSDLLTAVAQLQAGGLPCALSIGGAGPEHAALERQAAALGVNCQWLGQLDRASVRAAMQACDLLVLASHHETFGVVLIEAMSCGKPVVATRCGGPDHLVTPAAGLLVPPRDPAALAAAIRTAVTAPTHYDGAAIRSAVAARFGAPAIAAQLTALYEQVIRTAAAR